MMKSADNVRRSACYPFSSIFRGRGGAYMEIAILIVLEILRTLIKEAVTYGFKKLTSKNKKKTHRQPRKRGKSSKRK